MRRPPDEAALLSARAIANGDEAEAAAIWTDCTPRARLDLAVALSVFLVVAWGDNPAALDHIERRLRAALS